MPGAQVFFPLDPRPASGSFRPIMRNTPDSPDKKKQKQKLLALFLGMDLLLVLYIAGAWFFSDVMVHFKQRTLAEDQANLELSSTGDYGLPAPEDVRIVSAFTPPLQPVAETDVVELHGWYFQHPTAKATGRSKCAVILQHGHTGTRWGAIKYGPLFWKRGCDLLSLDARYHGESGGSCGSYGYHERHDTRRAIAWLQERTGLPKQQIGLMGESMGAAIALMTAAQEPELAFVAADSSYGDLRSVLKERGARQYGNLLLSIMLPGAEFFGNLRCNMEVGEVSPAAQAARIQIPAFINHSAADTGTLPYHSEEIYAALPGDARVLHINEWDAPHCRDINVNYSGYEAHMDAFLAQHVPAFGR